MVGIATQYKAMYYCGMSDRRAPTPEERAVGDRLRELRRQSGRKVWEIAHDLGMGEQNYLGYETGRNQIKVLNVPDFARALRIHPHDLFELLFPVPEDNLEVVPKDARPDPKPSASAWARFPMAASFV